MMDRVVERGDMEVLVFGGGSVEASLKEAERYM